MKKTLAQVLSHRFLENFLGSCSVEYLPEARSELNSISTVVFFVEIVNSF